MELWRGDLPDFIKNVDRCTLVPSMVRQFERYHSAEPSPAEQKSWELSLRAMAEAAEGRPDDIGVSVEYHLPLSGQRIDVLFTGRSASGRPSALVVELKHWDTASLEDRFALNVMVGGVEHVHPSQQAAGYVAFLKSVHSAFSEDAVAAFPSAYCHNLDEAGTDALRQQRFSPLIADSPLFSKGEHEELGS